MKRRLFTILLGLWLLLCSAAAVVGIWWTAAGNRPGIVYHVREVGDGRDVWWIGVWQGMVGAGRQWEPTSVGREQARAKIVDLERRLEDLLSEVEKTNELGEIGRQASWEGDARMELMRKQLDVHVLRLTIQAERRRLEKLPEEFEAWPGIHGTRSMNTVFGQWVQWQSPGKPALRWFSPVWGTQGRRVWTRVTSAWVVLGALASPVLIILVARGARRWRRSGGVHCQKCGYDLRATPERCPECGRDQK